MELSGSDVPRRVKTGSKEIKTQSEDAFEPFVIALAAPSTRQSAKKRKLTAKSTTSSSALLNNPDDVEEDDPLQAKSRRSKPKGWQVSVK